MEKMELALSNTISLNKLFSKNHQLIWGITLIALQIIFFPDKKAF